MDWSSCIICGSSKAEPLKCPVDSLQKDSGLQVYTAFLVNVNKFKELGALPVNVDFGPEVTPELFVESRASWHKSCHLKFSNSKVERATKSKRKSDVCEENSSRVKRQLLSKTACIFCGQAGELHEVMTLDVDVRVREMATDLQDSALLKQLTGGDMIATEAKYHKKCMTNLSNRYRAFLRKSCNSQLSDEDELNEARAFVELVSYMESCVDDGKYVFTLSELHQLYISRLQDFGIDKSINKTRLKARILSRFPGELQQQDDGKNVLLVFNEGMASLLREELSRHDYESDALILAKAARIVRRDIFSENGFHFNGTFPSKCQNTSVPSCLKVLIAMLLNGSNIAHQDTAESQSTLTISQLVVFNSKKKSSSTLKASRHSLEREPPLPLYIGLSIHTLTRSKKIINQLYQLGISVSYDRVDDVINGLASAVCSRFQEDGMVCPLNLNFGLFTVGALDNIDHNPSSTTAQGSFHGTGISLFQFPSNLTSGTARPTIRLPTGKLDRKINLPESYTTVPAVGAKISELTVSETTYTESFHGNLQEAKVQEDCWAQHAVSIIDKEIENNDVISWSSYHGSLKRLEGTLPVISGLLPLFYEKASSLAMVKHGMDIQQRATAYLNPGQIPVTAFDQPLFAIAKFVQWNWPLAHGESKHVVMFGGLHLEMASWSLCGDLLENSGWTAALTEAGIASSGTADSFLKVTHLTRTRHAHQVTALALYKLQREAFLQTPSPLYDEEAFERWNVSMREKSPTYHFWDMILRLEILILIFIRSHREGNFALYVETLEALTPWFCALDHINYARWVPVHIKDMKSLPVAIKEDMHKYWVVAKTKKGFSSMPIDQAHEQNNAIVKGTGGAVGLTENPTAFRRWMVSGPEFARLLREFEDQYLCGDDPNDDTSLKHHEHGISTQKTFQQQVVKLANTIETLRNPFKGSFKELVNIESGDCASEEVVESLKRIESVGQNQYKKYVKEVIEDRTLSIHETIKKNSLPLFKRQQSKLKTKSKQQVTALKNDCSLFSRLYIATQHRSGDLEEFFMHENQPYPPSLSEFGNIRLGKKSDLLACIKPAEQPDPPSAFHCKIFDGAAIVHALPITTASTFNDYAENIFIPFIVSQLQSANRVDIVWDKYKENSIKDSTREKRGKGQRRKVTGDVKIPPNWKGFLQDNDNKRELFAFLTNRVAYFPFSEDKEVNITSEESVVSSRGDAADLGMQRCDHEEADTRIAVHVLHALNQSSSRVLIRTVDTDVVVIIIGLYHDLLSLHQSADIWIAFGMGKYFQYISINAICTSLGPETSLALPVFHSFTGCDTTSCFFGRGKKSAWDAWKSYPAVTEAFVYLKDHPYHRLDVDDPIFKLLERFTVVIYDKTSNLLSVNEARKEIFTKKNRTLENIPPTQDSLLQHVLRTIFQSSIWATGLQSVQMAPSPEGWGWTDNNNRWKPVWMTLPEAAKACIELLKCGCKQGCAGRCKCFKANLPCTDLCQCSGECNNNSDA